MKKFLTLISGLVFAMCLSAQVYYLLPNSADANCENITNQYDHPTEGNRLQWETSDGDAYQCPERNAFDWFARSYCDASIPWIHNEGDHQIRRIVTFKDLTDGRLAAEGNMFNDVKVLWVNVDRYMTVTQFDELFPSDVRTALANYVKAGGNLYLSTFAVRLAYLIGRTPEPGFSENDGFCCSDEWKVNAHFMKGGDGSYDVDKHGHAIFKYLRDNNLYADNYKFHMQKGTPRTNRNCLWDIDDNITAFNNFQNDNTCGILGSWGHTAEFLCAGLVEFYPVGDWKGTIITNGLAACSFASANTDRFCVEHLTRGILDYLKARPCDKDNVKSMEEKLAENGFYPNNTTTFRTLHPVCEDMPAAYSIASDPNGIARIQEGVVDGENTITQLQFKAEGTVTLHIVLTENREFKNWPKGTYEYDRAIRFAYANPNAAQEAVEADLSSDGKTGDKFMLLHPNIRGLDSVSYTIVNNYGGSGGQALKVKDSEASDAATRLCFTHKGSVQLQIKMNETDWVEAWPMGEKDFTKVVTFAFERPEGPTMNWPFEFFKGGIEPNSVITLPAQIEGLTPIYTVTGDATVEGNTLTVGDGTSGSFTVTASVTENDYKLAWPVGTYQFEKSLPVYASEVGYLLPAAESIDHMAGWYEGEQPEYNAATWFQENYIATGKGRFVTVNELPTLKAKGIKALWVNIERVNIDKDNGLLTACLTDDGLKTYIQAGGNVLLTKQATRLAYTMGRIDYEPAFNAGEYFEHTNPGDSRSISTRMGTHNEVDEVLDMSGHRLFADMLSWHDAKHVFLVGENCWQTNNYCSWQDFMRKEGEETHYDNKKIRRVQDFEADWNATVFGIQGDISDYCYSNVVEFNAIENEWAGRILTIGATGYQWGSANPTAELDNVKKLTANSLSYLLDEPLADEVYTRNGLTPGIYGTICFDYAVEAGHIEGAEIYELTSFNATNDGVILTQVDAMVAGRPYFFLATANELRLTYHGQRVAAGSYHGLVGHIGETTLHITPNDNNYILYNNELLLVNTDDIELPSYRAYINKYDEIPAYSEPTSNAPRRIMAIEPPLNAPTAVEAVDMQAAQGVYDIMGRKLSAPQGNGFYIINGQKVIITQ